MGPYAAAVKDTKKRIVLQALEAHQWNIHTAAAWLGIDRNTVYRVMRVEKIFRPKLRPAAPSPP